MVERATQTVAQQNRHPAAKVTRSPELTKRPNMLAQNELHEWQSTLGNQGMQRSLLAGGSGIPILRRKCAACAKQEEVVNSGVIQTKLAINKPGDVFEQEADRVADAVMSDNPMYVSTPIGGPVTGIQRTCECGGTCDDCKRKGEVIQRSTAIPAAQVGAAPPVVHEVLNTPGHSLDGATRNLMESRFGADFGDVRVHTDSRAAESASAVNALAYTVEKDVVFARNKYAPASHSGQRLLAHELTHVMQQNQSPPVANNTRGLSSNQNPLLSRSEKVLQRACGPKEIAASADCTPSKQEPTGDLVLFKVNCDEFATARDKQTVVDFADSMGANDSVVVHGFASTDGDPTFNDNLSCSRAIKAQGVLKENKVDDSKVSLVKHGATPGLAAQRRSVVLERNPGSSRQAIPQLRADIVTAPTGGICGADTFVIRWSLSRNSDTLGGFVIQDVLFNWDVRDCTGAAIPTPPFTSPLRYFEAWRVPPLSAQPNATKFTQDTDQFTWPADPPWAGGCSDGKVSITATAHYFDKQTATALPPSMIQFNPKTFANDLFSGLSNPALGGTVSRPVAHSLTFHWNCCPCSSSPTAVDSHTP